MPGENENSRSSLNSIDNLANSREPIHAADEAPLEPNAAQKTLYSFSMPDFHTIRQHPAYTHYMTFFQASSNAACRVALANLALHMAKLEKGGKPVDPTLALKLQIKTSAVIDVLAARKATLSTRQFKEYYMISGYINKEFARRHQKRAREAGDAPAQKRARTSEY